MVKLFGFMKRLYDSYVEKNEENKKIEKELFEINLKKQKISEIEFYIQKELKEISLYIRELRDNGFVYSVDKPNLRLYSTDGLDVVIEKMENFLNELTEYKKEIKNKEIEKVYLSDKEIEVDTTKNENDFVVEEPKVANETDSIKSEKEIPKNKEVPKIITLQDKYFNKNSIQKILNEKTKITDRDDRIAKFIKGEKKLSLGDIFGYYNPQYIKFVMYMEDLLKKSEYKSEGRELVEFGKKISYKQFLRNCVTMRNNSVLDLSKFDSDLNFSGLEVFVGVQDIDKIKIKESQIRDSQNKKWNLETIAILLVKNDITLEIVAD